MIELRWLTRSWAEWREDGATRRFHERTLQFRERQGPPRDGWWSDWKDVPEVYEDLA